VPGFAVAPVFAGVTTSMALQTKLVVRCEVRNKKARELEDVARGYYDVRFYYLFFSFFWLLILLL
jgi:ATP-binding cassette, subfamily B (MDR/TAP), member 1